MESIKLDVRSIDLTDWKIDGNTVTSPCRRVNGLWIDAKAKYITRILDRTERTISDKEQVDIFTVFLPKEHTMFRKMVCNERRRRVAKFIATELKPKSRP